MRTQLRIANAQSEVQETIIAQLSKECGESKRNANEWLLTVGEAIASLQKLQN